MAHPTSTGLLACAPSAKQDGQIGRVHVAIPVEIGGTALAWPPATQQNRQVKRFDLTVPVQVLRTRGVALIHEQAHHEFRMIDKRIAIALKRKNNVIAILLNIIHRVLLVPRQQDTEHPHVGDGFVVARVAGGDEGRVVRENQIGFGCAGVAVSPALVTDVGIQQRSCNIAFFADPRFPNAA